MQKKRSARHGTASNLVQRLAEAFGGTSVPGLKVIDEPVRGTRYRHLTIVWDEWQGVPQPERGKTILDAFERANPEKPWRVLEVTLAVGLTPEEARRLNLKTA